MLEIVQAGGWLMVPIIACSVVMVAIVLERLWTLQEKRVLPPDVGTQVAEWIQHNQLDVQHLQQLHKSSPLGQVLAAGLAYRHASRDVLKEVVEDTGRHVVHDLERYLGPLGTIAAISPLLGLLGTVSGMIRSFTAIIDPPQVAILAVGSVRRAPVEDDPDGVVFRDLMTVTLTCDHRVVYGADGAQFLSRLRELLGQPLVLAV